MNIKILEYWIKIRISKFEFMTYQTLGIILKKIDFGEADQLVTVYTEKRGKIIALVRGAKKISSKLNYQLQFFSIIDLMIADGKKNQHIAGALAFKSFSAIGKDLKKIILATFALELVEKMVGENQADKPIFNLLINYLVAVNDKNFTAKEWQLIREAFIVKLLSLLGFQPTLDIATNSAKLNLFLKDHLNSELKTEIFVSRIKAWR